MIGPSQPFRALYVGVSKPVSLNVEIEQIFLFDTKNEKRSRQDKLEQVVTICEKTRIRCDLARFSEEQEDLGFA